MGDFHPLTDEEWKQISVYMNWSPTKTERGTKRSSFRTVWNSILYVLIHQARWNDIPKTADYAHRSSAHRWLIYWEETGILERVICQLQKNGYFKPFLSQNLDTQQMLHTLKRRNRKKREPQSEVHPIDPLHNV